MSRQKVSVKITSKNNKYINFQNTFSASNQTRGPSYINNLYRRTTNVTVKGYRDDNGNKHVTISIKSYRK